MRNLNWVSSLEQWYPAWLLVCQYRDDIHSEDGGTMLFRLLVAFGVNIIQALLNVSKPECAFVVGTLGVTSACATD